MLLKFLLLFMLVAYLDAQEKEISVDDYLRATRLSSYEILKQEWKIFQETYGKKYRSLKENLKRRQIFAQNKLFIARHNDLYKKGGTTFTLKMNKFGDKTFDEFKNYYGLNNPMSTYDDVRNNKDNMFISTKLNGVTDIPKEFDWRKEGAVTEVKDQGNCGACWAFSATGVMEGYYFRGHNYLLSLSEQNLIDCSSGYGNHGCAGGTPWKAFKYIKNNHGIDTELGYSFKDEQEPCRFNRTYAVPNANYYYIVKQDEVELENNVVRYGPASVLIDVNDNTIQFYEKGVYYSTKCSSNRKDLNHAVLIVGYGISDIGGKYWLVKNSWGMGWGEEGYIWMAKDRNNNCGIATEAIVAV